MRGAEVLWVPGLDHAGIATQYVVERHLRMSRGVTREQLGRESFVKEVWGWRKQYGDRINDQQRRLGASLDWSREYFTLDEPRSKAVIEAFVELYDRGLIYRAERLVNWCCHLRTALSDIEVDYIDIEGPTPLKLPGRAQPVTFGVAHRFVYPLAPQGTATDSVVPPASITAAMVDQGLEVMTTRLETMLADTAVAVHPDDARYRHAHGRHVIHPLTGRLIPVVTDSILVDPASGTGVVKVTPAHSVDDQQCALRLGLPSITMLDQNGLLNSHPCIPAELRGIDRLDARQPLVGALQRCGVYRGQQPHTMRLGICSRSGDVIEPLPVPQWYVDCKPLTRDSLAQVKEGLLKLLPADHGYDAVWERWLNNTEQWCVSRQLWWGHRVPAYRVHVRTARPPPPAAAAASAEPVWVVGRSEAEAMARACAVTGRSEGDLLLEQDEDVLDTWFSSGLLPLSALGWGAGSSTAATTSTAPAAAVTAAGQAPDTDLLQRFYPLSLMETGSDILFFWVARMTMLCSLLQPARARADAIDHQHQKPEQARQVPQPPFGTVFLHPVVRDSQGQKMSKSKGNVIDPLEVMEGRSLDELKQRLVQTLAPGTTLQQLQALQRTRGALSAQTSVSEPSGASSKHLSADDKELIRYSTPVSLEAVLC